MKNHMVTLSQAPTLGEGATTIPRGSTLKRVEARSNLFVKYLKEKI